VAAGGGCCQPSSSCCKPGHSPLLLLCPCLQELMEGGSLFEMLNVQSKASKQRVFSWHNRYPIPSPSLCKAYTRSRAACAVYVAGLQGAALCMLCIKAGSPPRQCGEGCREGLRRLWQSLA
jgi:hypothetical protein